MLSPPSSLPRAAPFSARHILVGETPSRRMCLDDQNVFRGFQDSCPTWFRCRARPSPGSGAPRSTRPGSAVTPRPHVIPVAPRPSPGSATPARPHVVPVPRPPGLRSPPGSARRGGSALRGVPSAPGSATPFPKCRKYLATRRPIGVCGGIWNHVSDIWSRSRGA